MSIMDIAQNVAILLYGVAILLHIRQEAKQAHGKTRK